MNRLGIYDHITDEELDEVMAKFCAVDKYGGKVELLTREDLIIIKQSLIYLANAYNKDCPFTQRQLLETEYKIKDVFQQNNLLKGYNDMVATKTDGIITYIGFDSANNGKRWIKEKGRWTYVTRQKDEWTQEYIPIAAYDVEYLKEAKRCRYVTPPYSIEKRIMDGEIAYHFWKGKDYWFFDKEEAIQFIYDNWDNKS